mgnify:FL=1
MKRVLLLSILLLFTAFLVGCECFSKHYYTYQSFCVYKETENSTDKDTVKTEDTAFGNLKEMISQSGNVVGIAFIGYVDSDSSEADLRSCFASSKTGMVYPDLADAALYMAEGQELYAIVPTNSKGNIKVYPSTMTEEGNYADDKSNPLCIGKLGEVLLLRCNLSEIYSNVLITVNDGGGALDFRPSLSMENGHFRETTGVYDFSVYEELPDERSVEIAMELLRETDEVKYAMERGKKLMFTGDMQLIDGRPCLLIALGTDHDEQFVREQLYGVCDNLIYAYDAVGETWAVLGVR